jgi:hypothetical protein
MGAIQKKKEYHDFINKCELAMSKAPAEFPLVHKFAPGIYRREMFIPQGGFLSSMVHLHENFFEVVSGTINILTEDGITQFIAPADGISKKGSRKLGFAITDVIFVTYHPNPDNCKDIPTLEKLLFKTYKKPLLKLK